MVVHMDASQPGARSAAVNLCMYRCEGMARIASKERAGVYIPIGERWWWRGRTQMKAETAEAEPTSKTIRRPGQGRPQTATTRGEKGKGGEGGLRLVSLPPPPPPLLPLLSPILHPSIPLARSHCS